MKSTKLSSFISIALIGVFILASTSISFCQESETPLEKNYNVGKEVEINQMGKKLVETSDFDKHIKITDKEVLVTEDDEIVQRYKVIKKEVIS